MRTTSCPLLAIVGFGPEGARNRQGSPLDKRLTQESGTLHSPVYPVLLAAALGHWSDASTHLEFRGTGVTVALFAKSNKQARRQSRTYARQCME